MKWVNFQTLLHNIPFCSLGEVGGSGQDCQILFPVFGSEMATAKIQTVKGFRAEIFALFAKKYYSSLDGLDSRNGVRYRLVSLSECGIISTAQADRQIES